MSDKIARTAQLKVLKYKSGRKSFSPSPIQDYLSKVSDNAKTVGDRYKEVSGSGGVKFCCFFNNLKVSKNKKAVAFEFCTFVPGDVPSQMLLDLSKADISHDNTPIIDPQTSKAKEVVHIVEVFACGEILIVESVKGSGGLAVLGDYLTDQLRKHIDPNLPRLTVVDLIEDKLADAIDAGGGVREIEMGMVRTQPQNQNRFENLLSGLIKEVGDTNTIQVSFSTSTGKLADKDVVEAFSEFDDSTADGLSKVTLHLNNGGTINGFNKYKVRKRVEVTDAGGKTPNRFELRKKLSEYFKELQTVKNGKRTIDDHGMVVK